MPKVSCVGQVPKIRESGTCALSKNTNGALGYTLSAVAKSECGNNSDGGRKGGREREGGGGR